jgi:phosphonate C-P lyase system protein PhnG
MADRDYILCECELPALEAFVESLEPQFEVKIASMPAVCLTMIKAEDSVESQPFYLGEALTSESEVIVGGRTGIGLCLGDEPVRSYCLAFIDAIVQLPGPHLALVESFLEDQAAIIAQREQMEHNLIMRTRVDFKLMEQD